MLLIEASLSLHLNEKDDWRVEINGEAYDHVSSDIIDGLIEYAMFKARLQVDGSTLLQDAITDADERLDHGKVSERLIAPSEADAPTEHEVS